MKEGNERSDRWRDWHKLRKPAAWVMRVAINYCNRWWRQIGNREVLASSLEDLELTIEDLAEAAPVVESLDPDLLKAIADLSARQRTVVALQDLYGLRPNQIAEVLGIKSSTVSVHYGRAMDALRKRLSDWEEEDGC